MQATIAILQATKEQISTSESVRASWKSRDHHHFRSKTNMALLVIVALCLAGISPLLVISAPLAETPKVEVGLYYESLCPDCQRFILKQLYPTFVKVRDIVNITLIPYGNANEQKDGDKWKFECQHGSEECVGNIIETCAISILKNISEYFPFVDCFEQNIDIDAERKHFESPHSVAAKCAEKLGIDYAPIDKCQAGPLGNKLEHEMAKKTDALEPQHQYTPWVTLNGKHTEKIQDKAERDMLKLVCETYQGPKPSACPRSKSFGRCYNSCIS